MKNRLQNLVSSSGNGRTLQPAAGERLAPPALPRRMLDRAARSVGDHPVASLGAAFVAGILLAYWVKRT
jgi:hypothetical protein